MSESTRLKKLTAALEFDPYNTLPHYCGDKDPTGESARIVGSAKRENARLSPIHSALKAVVAAAEQANENLRVSDVIRQTIEKLSRLSDFEVAAVQEAHRELTEALAALDSELAKLADKADQFDGSERSSNGLEGRG